MDVASVGAYSELQYSSRVFGTRFEKQQARLLASSTAKPHFRTRQRKAAADSQKEARRRNTETGLGFDYYEMGKHGLLDPAGGGIE